jgi:hypothetical protein
MRSPSCGPLLDASGDLWEGAECADSNATTQPVVALSWGGCGFVREASKAVSSGGFFVGDLASDGRD